MAEGIAKITIDRPEVRNAFRPETLIEISDAMERAREDAEVGVIVLTGEGPDAFCSGGDQRVRGDTGYVAGGASVGRFHVTDLHVQIRRLPKPVVAMVAGYAIGGGHVLHLVCDLTIAADNARFGQVGPKRRLVRRRLRRVAAARPGRAEEGEGVLAAVPPVRRAAGARDGARQHRRAAGAARGGDRPVVPRDARAVAVRAAAREGELPRRTRTASRASSSSRTTPTSSSTAPRRRRRGARPTRRSAPPTSRRSRAGRERPLTAERPSAVRIWVMAARPRTLPAGGGAGAGRHRAGGDRGHVQGPDVRGGAARRAVHPGRDEPLQRLLRRPPRRRHRGPARARCG